MPDYKRLVSYMYTYEEGKKRNNVGYVKVESRNGQCKFTIHASALSYSDKTITVYAFRRAHGLVEGVELGTGRFKNGVLDIRIVTDPEHLANSNLSIHEIGGVVLYLNDMKYLATSWEEEAITYNQVMSIVSRRDAYSKSVTSSKNTTQEKVEPVVLKVAPEVVESRIVDDNITSVNEAMNELYSENMVENERIEESNIPNNVVSFDKFILSTEEVSSRDNMEQPIEEKESSSVVSTIDHIQPIEEKESSSVVSTIDHVEQPIEAKESSSVVSTIDHVEQPIEEKQSISVVSISDHMEQPIEENESISVVSINDHVEQPIEAKAPIYDSVEPIEPVVTSGHAIGQSTEVNRDNFIPARDEEVLYQDSLVEDITNKVISESYAQLDALDTKEVLEQQSSVYKPYPTNLFNDTTVEAAQLTQNCNCNHNHNNYRNKPNSNNSGTMNYNRNGYRNRTPQNQRQYQQRQNQQPYYNPNQQPYQQRQNQQQYYNPNQQSYQQRQNQPQYYTPSQQSNQQRQNQQPKRVNSTPATPNMPFVSSQDEPYIATRFMKEFPRMHPFEDNEVVWSVRIEPKDIGILPVDVWPLANNSFLLHGFYAHKHLLFAKINSANGNSYILGVPGIYHDRERFLAKMFGFENFKCSKRGEVDDGESGYWYLPIRLV